MYTWNYATRLKQNSFKNNIKYVIKSINNVTNRIIMPIETIQYLTALNQAKYLKVDKKTGNVAATNWLSNIFEKIKGKFGFCDWTNAHLIQSQTLFLIEKIGNNENIELITTLAQRVGLLPKGESPRNINDLTSQIFRQMVVIPKERSSDESLFLTYRNIHQKNLSKFNDFFSHLHIPTQPSPLIVSKPVENVTAPEIITPPQMPPETEILQQSAEQARPAVIIQEIELQKAEPELISKPQPEPKSPVVDTAVTKKEVEAPEAIPEQIPQDIQKKTETPVEASKEQNKFAKIDAQADKEIAKLQNKPNVLYVIAVDFMKEEKADDERNQRFAYKFCKASAEGGFAYAQTLLSSMYLEGTAGVDKDVQEAFRWGKLAAEQGDKQAQYQVAIFYRDGIGTAEDHIEAYKWFEKAANQGKITAQFMMGWYHQKNARMAEENGRQDEAKAEIQKAIEWHTKAAEQGFTHSQDNLGLLYWQRGRKNKDESDLKLAFEWCEKAAIKGVVTSQERLGMFYITEVGVKADRNNFNKGLVWTAKAAKQGSKVAEETIQDVKKRFKAANGEKMITEAKKGIDHGKKEIDRLEKLIEQHKAKVTKQELEKLNNELENLRREYNFGIEFVAMMESLR